MESERKQKEEKNFKERLEKEKYDDFDEFVNEVMNSKMNPYDM